MKKIFYKEAEIDVISFSCEDIVTASGEPDDSFEWVDKNTNSWD